MSPPLREPEDREAIRQGLRDGTIDAICTDHAPHHYDAKEREFDDAPNGIIGLETISDPKAAWTVNPDVFFSRSRNTPFAGRRLTGRAELTIVRGQVVYRREP